MPSSGFLSGFRARARSGAVHAEREQAVVVPSVVFVPGDRTLPINWENAHFPRSGESYNQASQTNLIDPGRAIDTVVAPRRVAANPTVLCIGDSLTNRMMPALDRALRGHGMRPDYVGTMEQVGGFRGEAREGKMAAQYALGFPGMSPVPLGDEGRYLALPGADRLHRNPFAVIGEDGAPSIEIAAYFARFAVPVPDYVIFALGTNDVSVRPASAVSFVERALDIVIPQLLALTRGIRIGLLQHVTRRVDDASEARWSIHLEIIRACIAAAAAEPRVDLLPAYLHQSATEGWPNPGPEDGGSVDLVHFEDPNAEIAASVVAAWIANHEGQINMSTGHDVRPHQDDENQLSTLERPASPEDVSRLFQLVLGRPPESSETLQQATGLAAGDLLASLLTSEEYVRRQPGDAAERLRRNYPVGQIEVDATPKDYAQLVERTRDTWAKLGAEDPYWSVMTNDAFRGGSIGGKLAESFFDSGRDEIADFTAACARNGLAMPTDGAIVELGCGVGRIGVHLSQMFKEYVGVDISPPHLRLAGMHLARADAKNATFATLNEFIESGRRFDCFYTLITLQHSPPPIVCAILRVLLNGLNVGGVGYFQIPHALYDYSFSVSEYLSRPNAVGDMELHAVPQSVVFRLLREAGCDLIESLPDGRVGASGPSTTYLVRKAG